MRILSSILLSAALAMPTLADTIAAPTIHAIGTGSVEVKPDIATLTIMINNQADTPAAALEANSTAIAALRSGLASAGIGEDDILASNLYLSANWGDYESGSPRVTGYSASNSVTATVANLDQLGAVYQSAIAGGANALNGVVFGLSDPAPALDEARKEAVAAARANAEVIATAAGLKLGRIVSITETPAQPTFNEYDMKTATVPSPVSGGELTVSASVTIQFELIE